MTAHTTHFEDCGCQSAAHEAEIREYREAAIAGAAYWQAEIQRLKEKAMCSECDALRAEVERLREALNAAYVYYSGPQDDSQVADLIREALAGKDGGEG